MGGSAKTARDARRWVAIAAATLACAAPLAVDGTARGSGLGTRQACQDEDLVPAEGNLDRVADAVLCLVNQRRADRGLGPLGRDPRLDRSALFHSTDMVREGFFAHQGPGRPSLKARVDGFGYFDGAEYILFAENIGFAPYESATPRGMVDAWMGSGDHRVNIAHVKLADIGIGIVLSGPHGSFDPERNSAVFTTDFGRRYTKDPRRARTCSASKRKRSKRSPSKPKRRSRSGRTARSGGEDASATPRQRTCSAKRKSRKRKKSSKRKPAKRKSSGRRS